MPKKHRGDSGPPKANGGREVPDPERLAEVAANQAAAASDQSAADADQTGADEDQTASDVERDLAVLDQRASDRDQLASDRDQAVSDQELRDHPGTTTREAHNANFVERQIGSTERRKAGKTRADTAEHRLRVAAGRDDTASHRDLNAQARDSAAERRDRDSAKIERKMSSRGSPLRSALTHASEIRSQAARDRARAAEDRAQAASDRERAAEERDAALDELRRAHLDELTGAFRRGSGEAALQAEIDRARRGAAGLVLAFVDVDDLREVNNRDGHTAGDALLREVVDTIRAQIRSYEPIVRYGGDEFVCAVGDLDLGQAQERFRGIQEALAAAGAGTSVTVGLAELRQDDTLADLVERADASLLDARRERSPRVD